MSRITKRCWVAAGLVATIAALAPAAGADDSEPFDLSISAIDVPPALTVGVPAVIEVTIHNAGPAVAPEPILAVDWPFQVMRILGTTGEGLDCVDGMDTWCVAPPLSAGASTTVGLEVEPLRPGQFTQSFGLARAVGESDYENNELQAVLDVGGDVPTADVSVVLQPETATPTIDEPVTTTIVVRNEGPEVARQIRLHAWWAPTPTDDESIEVPAGTTCYLEADDEIWCFLDVVPNSESWVDLTVVPRAVGDLHVQAEIEYYDDADSGDRHAIETLAVRDSPAPDLAIGLSAPTGATVGEPFEVEVPVSNNGTAPASGLWSFLVSWDGAAVAIDVDPGGMSCGPYEGGMRCFVSDAAASWADALSLTMVAHEPGALDLDAKIDVPPGGGEVEDEASASVDVLPHLTPPSRPTRLRARPLDHAIRVRWEPPISDGGEPVERYEARIGSQRCSTSGFACTIEGLRAGVERRVRVVAVNAIGEGPVAVLGSVTPGSDDGAYPWVRGDVRPSGTVRSWGHWHGVPPSGLDQVVDVEAGSGHVVVLRSDGSVVAWGLPVGGLTAVPPEAVDVIAIDAGVNNSLAVTQDGSVVVWGWPGYGRAVVPARIQRHRVVDVAAGALHFLALTRTGRVLEWGANADGVPSDLPPDVVAISAGNLHSLALTQAGQVVVWGDDVAGATDVPDDLGSVVAIAAGVDHSLALQADGAVVAWGSNELGQTDVPAGLSDVVAIDAGHFQSVALTRSGEVVVWGASEHGEALVPDDLGDVIDLASGGEFNLVVERTSRVR